MRKCYWYNTDMKRLILALVLGVASAASAEKAPGMHYDRYFNHYTDSFVTKIFMKSKTQKGCATTMDQVRELIRNFHEMSGGLHQIIYLVGWQYDGHDSKYPSLDKVGDQCKSSLSDDPLTSLRMAMREAREKYNCDLSLHINLNDAHPDSPDWKLYNDKDLLCKDKNGNIRKLGTWYRISHVKEWKSGYVQKRIDALLNMIPEIKDAKTIHIDAFFAQSSDFDGISIEDDKAAIKAITDYWHARGIDVTNEFITSLDMIGYFPMVYHYNLDERQRMLYPVDVVAPGDDIWNVRAGRDYHGAARRIAAPVDTAPASGSYYEEAWGTGCFCDLFPMYLAYQNLTRALFRNTFLFTWYNQHPLVEHVVTPTDYKVRRAHGVEANVRMRDRHLTVTQDGRVVVDGGDCFLDQSWGVVLAYSRDGCDRAFELPHAWRNAKTLVGQSFPSKNPCTLSVRDGRVRVQLSAGESLVLRRTDASL